MDQRLRANHPASTDAISDPTHVHMLTLLKTRDTTVVIYLSIVPKGRLTYEY